MMFRVVLERTLWCVAAVALFAYALERTEAFVYQSHVNWELSQDLATHGDGALGVRHASTSRGQALGRIEIPAIDLSVIFLQGDDNETLRHGIGHIPGTALPGQAGNVGLSGHRDTFFRRLGQLRRGDAIFITTLEGHYQYVVENTKVVNPDERIELRDIGSPVLTLVTCYPFWNVGPAPQRFIVHATLVTE